MKTIAVMITSSPLSNLTATSIALVEQLAARYDTEVIGVFFYQEGALNASASTAIPADEYQTIKQWQTLHQAHSIPLHLCITAAEKRGLSDDWQDSTNILPEFTVSGLGEFVSLYSAADQVIQL
ncbi:sulfurtransferase complex subunit TusD [Thalassotalea sp. LPB0316]|uniref:sulfurtransferase complex subunit TusD n=1 Tax=Thalassotalea sp. LPB0316 TaxID=2769490 RepID=UPI001865F892|nr:sulfurtransferase complex subunit TusD [Thalassotalea sp. LPB0316]QOL25006.1 sulfurtransferase complex subunit TusD [Thalassotalea sp. LPB0316]